MANVAGMTIERELLFTGLGGQGIQLAAKTLAAAAVEEAREVMVFGTYGGSMRGGTTDAGMIVGSGPLLAPPVVEHAWAAMVMHHHHWEEVRPRLRPGSVLIVDTGVFRGDLGGHPARIIEMRATAIALERGFPRTSSMILLGALAAATQLVKLESLLKVSRDILPSYRAQFAAANGDAIRFGYESIAAPLVRAWEPDAANAQKEAA